MMMKGMPGAAGGGEAGAGGAAGLAQLLGTGTGLSLVVRKSVFWVF